MTVEERRAEGTRQIVEMARRIAADVAAKAGVEITEPKLEVGPNGRPGLWCCVAGVEKTFDLGWSVIEQFPEDQITKDAQKGGIRTWLELAAGIAEEVGPAWGLSGGGGGLRKAAKPPRSDRSAPTKRPAKKAGHKPG